MNRQVWPGVDSNVELPLQIYLVTFTNTQLTQASFLQNNQTWQNVFLIVVMLRWHRASAAEFLKLIILTFYVKN
jgi:hypothetical protein